MLGMVSWLCTEGRSGGFSLCVFAFWDATTPSAQAQARLARAHKGSRSYKASTYLWTPSNLRTPEPDFSSLSRSDNFSGWTIHQFHSKCWAYYSSFSKSNYYLQKDRRIKENLIKKLVKSFRHSCSQCQLYSWIYSSWLSLSLSNRQVIQYILSIFLNSWLESCYLSS